MKTWWIKVINKHQTMNENMANKSNKNLFLVLGLSYVKVFFVSWSNISIKKVS